MGTDLSIVPTREEVATLERVAAIIAQSGMIRDARKASEAFTKLIYGRDLGLTPTQALAGLHIIDGKPELSAPLKASLLRQHGYDYRVAVTPEQATVTIISRDGEVVGEAGFSMDEARKAGLVRKGSGWEKYPEDMLFARAMSRTVRRFAPEVLSGVPTYAEGELVASPPDEAAPPRAAPPEAEVIEVEYPADEGPVEAEVDADPGPERAEPEPDDDPVSQEAYIGVRDHYARAGLPANGTDDDAMVVAARFLREPTVEAALEAHKREPLLALATAYAEGARPDLDAPLTPEDFPRVLRLVQASHPGQDLGGKVEAALEALSDPVPF